MRSRLSLSLGALVSAVAVAAVVWWILRQNAPTLPHSAAGFSWLLGSLALSIVAYAVRGWRWHRVMRIAAVDHRPLDAYALTTDEKGTRLAVAAVRAAGTVAVPRPPLVTVAPWGELALWALAAIAALLVAAWVATGSLVRRSAP